jgi:hypothetical protein
MLAILVWFCLPTTYLNTKLVLNYRVLALPKEPKSILGTTQLKRMLFGCKPMHFASICCCLIHKLYYNYFVNELHGNLNVTKDWIFTSNIFSYTVDYLVNRMIHIIQKNPLMVTPLLYWSTSSFFMRSM